MSDIKEPTAMPSIIIEAHGDLFNAPENAVLIHACNCVGSWGAGIAKAFQTKYPAAYKVHRKFCRDRDIEDLIGTCQLIPPQDDDYKRPSPSLNPRPKRRRIDASTAEEEQDQKKPRKHWIACLFTSRGYGKPTKKRPGKDSPEVILDNTTKSLVDFREQLKVLWTTSNKGNLGEGEDENDGEIPGELWSCKFNSGLFAVEWADTKKVLEQELGVLNRPVQVMSPEGS